MGHMSTAWKDSPKGAGLLPTSQVEAEIAQFHTGWQPKAVMPLKCKNTR